MEKHACPPIGPAHRRSALKVRYHHPEAGAWAAHLRATRPHLVVTGGLDPSPNEVDVTAPSTDKGTVLRRITAHLGVDPARVVAFGDSDNDAPLLREAAFGVQVGPHAHLSGLADTRLGGQADLVPYLETLLAAPWPAAGAAP